jgi:hypothetical protein
VLKNVQKIFIPCLFIDKDEYMFVFQISFARFFLKQKTGDIKTWVAVYPCSAARKNIDIIIASRQFLSEIIRNNQQLKARTPLDALLNANTIGFFFHTVAGNETNCIFNVLISGRL